MTQSTPKTIEQIVVELKKSPISNLSLTSHELFHSNFLAWLCDTYREECGKFFKAIVGRNFTASLSKVKREEGNIDIKLVFGDEKSKKDCYEIWIENKMKSLPNSEQLKGYADSVGKRSKDRTFFILLSLSKPNFSNENDWKHLNYSQLIEMLNGLMQKVPEGSYARFLLNDYINYLQCLVDLMPHLRVNWCKPKTLKYFDDNIKKLESNRLDSLAFKVVFDQLAEQLKKKLQDKGFQVVAENKSTKNSGEVYVRSDFTNNSALVEAAFVIIGATDENVLKTIREKKRNRDKNLCVVGVQIQSDQFRLFLYWKANQPVRSVACCIFKKNLWFDLSIGFGKEAKHSGKKDFNKYSDSDKRYDETFLFRYYNLNDKKVSKDKEQTLKEVLNLEEILDKVVLYIEKAREKQLELEQAIAECVQSQKPVKE